MKITRAVRIALSTNPFAQLWWADGSLQCGCVRRGVGPGVVAVMANGKLNVIEKCDVEESWGHWPVS